MSKKRMVITPSGITWTEKDHREYLEGETDRDIWEAFSTLSDAQLMVEMNNEEKANDLINHAKLHIMRAMDRWGEGRRSEAMTNFKACDVNEWNDNRI